MYKIKNRKKIFAGILLFLMAIQFLSLLDFGMAQEELDDENDLGFQVVGNMNITNSQMVGGNDMGIGSLTIQDTGTFNRWYKEPNMPNGEFELNNLRFDFDDINEPLYSETIPNYLNVSTENNPYGDLAYNTTYMDEYSVSNDKITQIAVNFDYNMSYPENNVTSINNNFGDVTGNLNSLNDTDGDIYEIHTEYEHAQRYNISNSIVSYGTESGDIEDLKEDDMFDYYTLTSEKYPDASFDGAKKTSFGWHSSVPSEVRSHEWFPSSGDHYSETEDYNDGDESVSGMKNTFLYAGFVGGSTYYEMSGLPADANLDEYYSLNFGVRFRYFADVWNALYDDDDYTSYCYMEIKNQITGGYERLRSITGNKGSYSSWSYGANLKYGSDIAKYVKAGKLNFRLRSWVFGTHIAIWGEYCGLYNDVDYVYASFLGANRIEVALETENIMNYAKVDFHAMSPGQYRIYTPGTTDHWNSMGTFDTTFDTELPNPLHYIYISVWQPNPVEIYIFYVGMYDEREFQKANQTFGFNFNGQDAINNEYNVSIRYKTSNSDVWELSFGNELLDQEYEVISTLDSTDWVSEEFTFSSIQIPNIRIFLQVSTYDYLGQDYLDILIDEINITAVYFPISSIEVINFNYTYILTTYTENFTLGFNSIQMLNTTHGNLSFIFTSEDFSIFDPEVPKAFVIPRQNLSLVIHFPIPYNFTFNASVTVKYSGVEWISSSEAGLQLNGFDVLPTSPFTAYIELYDFPNELDITAEVEITRFKLTSTINFDFNSELEIISRRVLKREITLISDHPIYIEFIEFDPDLALYSAWLDGFSYNIDFYNVINPGVVILPGQTMLLEIYLQADIYKELQTFYSNLGTGVYSFYLSGTTNDYFFDDATRDSNFFIQIPQYFGVENMDFLFSDFNWIEDYVSDEEQNIFDYGFDNPEWESAETNWNNQYYTTELNATKLFESGGSDFVDLYQNDFSTFTDDIQYENFPVNTTSNSTFSFQNGDLFMNNTLPNSALTFDGMENLNGNITDKIPAEIQNVIGTPTITSITYDSSTEQYFVLKTSGQCDIYTKAWVLVLSNWHTFTFDGETKGLMYWYSDATYSYFMCAEDSSSGSGYIRFESYRYTKGSHGYTFGTYVDSFQNEQAEDIIYIDNYQTNGEYMFFAGETTDSIWGVDFTGYTWLSFSISPSISMNPSGLGDITGIFFDTNTSYWYISSNNHIGVYTGIGSLTDTGMIIDLLPTHSISDCYINHSLDQFNVLAGGVIREYSIEENGFNTYTDNYESLYVAIPDINNSLSFFSDYQNNVDYMDIINISIDFRYKIINTGTNPAGRLNIGNWFELNTDGAWHILSIDANMSLSSDISIEIVNCTILLDYLNVSNLKFLCIGIGIELENIFYPDFYAKYPYIASGSETFEYYNGNYYVPKVNSSGTWIYKLDLNYELVNTYQIDTDDCNVLSLWHNGTNWYFFNMSASMQIEIHEFDDNWVATAQYWDFDESQIYNHGHTEDVYFDLERNYWVWLLPDDSNSRMYIHWFDVNFNLIKSKELPIYNPYWSFINYNDYFILNEQNQFLIYDANFNQIGDMEIAYDQLLEDNFVPYIMAYNSDDNYISAYGLNLTTSYLDFVDYNLIDRISIYTKLTITPDFTRNDFSAEGNYTMNMSINFFNDEYFRTESETWYQESTKVVSHIGFQFTNGTHNFIATQTGTFRVYDLDWNYLGIYYTYSTGDVLFLTGAYWKADENLWYVVDRFDTNIVHKYNWDFSTHSTQAITGGYGQTISIEFVKGYWYINHDVGEYIVKYDESWVFQTSYYLDVYLGWDLDFDFYNDTWYIMSFGDDRMERYDESFNFLGSEYFNNPTNCIIRNRVGDKQYFEIKNNNYQPVMFYVRREWINDIGIWNGFDNAPFSMRLNLTTEDGIISYNYSSYSNFTSINLNISQILIDNGKSLFYNFTIEFFIGGNPTNITIENITLYDYDVEFEDFVSLYISDSFAIAQQPLFIYWNYTENNPSHLIVNQSFIGVIDPNVSMHMIENYSIVDALPGILNSYEFFNVSSGFYEMNLTFYDLGGNYEIWYVNFSLVSLVSVSVSYQNPVLINNDNFVSVNLLSDYPIIQIHYDNSTDYVLEYDNSSYPLYFYEFNFSISYPLETNYNISVDCFTSNNDTFVVNITNLYFIERTTVLDIHNLHANYQQADLVNITVSLRDLYNIPIYNSVINSTLIAPNGTIMLSQLNYTDDLGEIYFNFSTQLNWDAGFYHINASYIGNESYYSAWELMSFELLPVVKPIANGSDIDFTINGEDLANNTWNISDLDASSFEFEVDHTGTCTFDLLLENVSLLIDLEFPYTEYVEHEFIFNNYNSYFTSILVEQMFLYDVPDNFTYYYFDNIQNENYNHIEHNDTLYPDQPIGLTYINLDGFIVELRYIENAVARTQLTATPSTELFSVDFEQTFIADLDYKYWYLVVDDDLNGINSLTHRRTSEIIASFTQQNESFYFDLTEKTQLNDIFDAELDLNPNWLFDYTVQDNGTFATITIDYSADFLVNNVDLVIDLSIDGTFHENWTLGDQTDDFVLTIPGIQFRNDIQQIIIYGNSTKPYATIITYESDQAFNQIVVGKVIDYAGFLNYPRFSTLFLFDKQLSWELINVYYGTQILPVETLSSTLGSFSSSGFSPSVSNSYIHFTETPFKTVDYVFDEDAGLITITINASLTVQNCYFYTLFDPSGAHTLEILSASNGITVLDLTDTDDWDGYIYFHTEQLNAGITIIKITVNFATPAEMWIQAIILIIVGGLFVGIYYYLKNNEKKLEKVRNWVEEKVIDKISKEKEEKGYSEITLRIEDNKILMEIPKKKKD